MVQTAPKLSQIKAQVQAIRSKVPGDRVIGLSAAGAWDEPAHFTLNGETFEVFHGRSALQIRERLSQLPPEGSSLVLLTTVPEADLGQDVIARLAKGRLFTIHHWEVVKTLFGAQHVDPAIVRQRCLAEALIDSVPVGGYPPVPSGVLDQETVWRVLLRERFGLDSGQPDLAALLRWSMYDENLGRLAGLPAELWQSARAWIAASAGRAGEVVLNCIEAGRGSDALPIGLACRVVAGQVETGAEDLKEAAVRLERYNAGHPVDREVALTWATAAEMVVEDLAEKYTATTVKPWLERADGILRELRVDRYAYLSHTSLEGFRQRLSRYGRALSAFLGGDLKQTPDEVADLADLVLNHDQGKQQVECRRRVEMSLRLARWLALPIAPERSTGFAAAAEAYARDGGFIDWARRCLAGGEDVEDLAAAYTTLKSMITERREGQNREFGRLLADWLAGGSGDDDVIAIEDVLSRVVVPLARTSPVLLIVMDGMNHAVFRELTSDLVRRGWVEHSPQGRSGMPPIIAAVPSVTEVSRASLLCGRVTQGDSSTEKLGFQGHAGLLTVCSSQSQPLVFHKGELAGAGGTDLDPDVRRQIASPRRKVVAAVVNAVDDHLLKGDQIYPRWVPDYIPVLQSLLQEAQQAGRTVILTSDHGHVLDFCTELRSHDEADRWRYDDAPPGEGEIAVKGRRVVGPGGKGLIVPWSERVRYGMKKNGYHGGLSPQEMVIPLAVLTASDKMIEGWPAVAPYVPGWWEESPEMEAAVVGRPAAVERPVAPKPEPATLFDFVPEREVVEVSRATWIDQLLGSEVFKAQLQLVARSAPPQEMIVAFVTALDQRGGKMTASAMARHLNEPAFRMNGLVAAMRRLLNVDGFPVLEKDEASDTIELNRDLLRTQFEIALVVTP